MRPSTLSSWTGLAGTALNAIFLAAPSPSMAQGALGYASVWECDAEKFAWYCDVPPPARPRATRPAPVPEPAKVAPSRRLEIKDIKSIEALRAEIKRREDLAIMSPTPENMRDYLEINAYMQDKASVFTDQWRRVVWQTPDLDYSTRNPSNNTAIRLKAEDREKGVDQAMLRLAREHGLLFFFRSDCPYCHAMAPNLKLMQERYGFEVLYVSMDGRPLPGLSSWIVNRGQYEKLMLRHQQTDARVPALFIASKRTGETAPLGVGTLAFTDITERIFVLTQTTPGSEF